ncbi:MAG: DUF1810 domain-containing protein [Erysipelotrichaceae bacterium]|nr:DUF1810 domain-containing protein [Erysipelotrichaceae bacterium]
MSDLSRFIKAQENSYDQALKEIKNGHKQSHWIWYIFPQIIGLGYSPTAVYYSINSIEEARDYYQNDIFGKRLIEITNVLLALDNSDPLEIMGYPDNLKLCSCMTLFDYVSDNDVFMKVLNKYYEGKKDQKTLDIIKELSD